MEWIVLQAIFFRILKLILMTEKNEQMVPDEMVMSKIYYIREQKVMLDRDLA